LMSGVLLNERRDESELRLDAAEPDLSDKQ
jgi:hypothetical protein